MLHTPRYKQRRKPRCGPTGTAHRYHRQNRTEGERYRSVTAVNQRQSPAPLKSVASNVAQGHYSSPFALMRLTAGSQILSLRSLSLCLSQSKGPPCQRTLISRGEHTTERFLSRSRPYLRQGLGGWWGCFGAEGVDPWICGEGRGDWKING